MSNVLTNDPIGGGIVGRGGGIAAGSPDSLPWDGSAGAGADDVAWAQGPGSVHVSRDSRGVESLHVTPGGSAIQVARNIAAADQEARSFGFAPGAVALGLSPLGAARSILPGIAPAYLLIAGAALLFLLLRK